MSLRDPTVIRQTRVASFGQLVDRTLHGTAYLASLLRRSPCERFTRKSAGSNIRLGDRLNRRDRP